MTTVLPFIHDAISLRWMRNLHVRVSLSSSNVGRVLNVFYILLYLYCQYLERPEFPISCSAIVLPKTVGYPTYHLVSPSKDKKGTQYDQLASLNDDFTLNFEKLKAQVSR
jgi:hypothetical protein